MKLNAVYKMEMGKSSIKLHVQPPVKVDEVLELVARENILDNQFKRLFQNQFTPVYINPNGSVEKPHYFSKALRERCDEFHREAVESSPDYVEEYVPKRERELCLQKLVLNKLTIRTLVIQLGFPDCDIDEGFLPEFDKKGVKLKDEFARDSKGAKIQCFHVRFDESVTDVEKGFISALAEGLYLDSNCNRKGCTVYIAKEVEVKCPVR